jgi:hypothetical protein
MGPKVPGRLAHDFLEKTREVEWIFETNGPRNFIHVQIGKSKQLGGMLDFKTLKITHRGTAGVALEACGIMRDGETSLRR